MSLIVEIQYEKRDGSAPTYKKTVPVSDLKAELEKPAEGRLVRRVRFINHEVIDETQFGAYDQDAANIHLDSLVSYANIASMMNGEEIVGPDKIDTIEQAINEHCKSYGDKLFGDW